MKCLARLMLFVGLLAVCLDGRDAIAQEDPGVTTTINLLKDTTKPQRDGSHNAMLLGLRQLEDPALLPLFSGLSNSPYLSMRIHGHLGSAALSPQRKINLSSLAEIKDQGELVQILSAAIDDGLVDNKGMTTLLTWEGLDLPLRQAIALRLIGSGSKVDIKPFRESLSIEINDQTPAAKLLQYAIASLLFAESGNSAGKAALNNIANLQSDNIDAVLGQIFDAAKRQDFATAGELALTIARDAERGRALRLLSIQTAMRLKAPGSPQAWQAMFKSEESTAQRIRLAMVALDSAEHFDPKLFDTLSGQGDWIDAIGKAGRAIAKRDQRLIDSFRPLLLLAQPIPSQWTVNYCRRTEISQGPDLLAFLIEYQHLALRDNRGRMAQAAIQATTALCELYPEQATTRLSKLLLATKDDTEQHNLQLRQVILMGIANARSKQLKALAEQITPDEHDDFTTDALRLFTLARHDVKLTDSDWGSVSDMIQGVGNLATVMRLQLGWAYLKHKGVADKSIMQALR